MTDLTSGNPWTTPQVRVVVVADLLAALVVSAAALAARNVGSLQDQVNWVTVAVLGLLLTLIAHGTLLLVVRRAIGRRRLEVLPDVVSALAPAAAAADGWRWLPGTTRAHSARCQMIVGKPAQTVSADQIRQRQLARCELCG